MQETPTALQKDKQVFTCTDIDDVVLIRSGIESKAADNG